MSGLGRSVDVAIVGGGAAGLITAIFAARRLPGRSIAILDGAKRLGAKILISGGGRCNVTNDVVTVADFCGGSRNTIRRVLDAFSVSDTVRFFAEIGVDLHVEPTGKLFPNTNRARTVLDALLAEAARNRVHILAEHRVTKVTQEPASQSDLASRPAFTLETPNGTIHAASMVLATGGRSVPKTGSDGGGYELARSLGHTIAPCTPALVPLVLSGDFHAALSGITLDVELHVRVEGSKPIRLRGSMLWTHFGISGPVVLDASRHWHAARVANRPVQLTANFFPKEGFEKVEQRILDRASAQPRLHLQNVLGNWLPARMAASLLTELGIDGQIAIGQLARERRRQLVHALTDWPLAVVDSRGYQYAEVTAGGVPLDEIQPATMASRRCDGLFLVGEILDVDGRIGGFNFQWAWSSAWVAAAGLAKRFAISP